MLGSKTELGEVLAETRTGVKITQQQLAAQLGVHQSFVSRLEQGATASDMSECVRILELLNTPAAQRIIDALRIDWKHLARPSLKHPDLTRLIAAEKALDRVDAFRNRPDVPTMLHGQADLLFRRLLESAEYLLRLDHKVTYIGDIGVGKTTAACRQSGLVLDPPGPSDLKGMLLDTGGGRTTLCEVLVQGGERFMIDVEPLVDEEVYRLVAELCKSVAERQDGKVSQGSSTEYKPPEEVERALRNLAGLPRPVRRKDAPAPADPAVELARQCTTTSEFTAEFASRLALWRRTRRSIEFDGTDEGEGRRWLRDTFTMINTGRHQDFSLPGRITITVPFSTVGQSPYIVSLVDTRGVDGSAIRPDILSQVNDHRALVVLCSKWGSAPDSSIQELLKHSSETEVDQSLIQRASILVLARSGDALSMRHDSGESAADADEGYEIKKGHVADALQRINMAGVENYIFDAASDDPSSLTDFFIEKIGRIRASQGQSADQTIAAIDQMLANLDKAHALAIQNAINKELSIFGERHRVLKAARKEFHLRLLDAIRVHHPRTVWATTRRAGSFWNFDVYQHLGDGVAVDAKRRAAQTVVGLREIVKNKLADESFASSHPFLGQILEDIDTWEADFVRAARHHAIAVVKPLLASASELWEKCEAKYGQGPGFKDEVAGLVSDWFEAHEELQEEIDRRLQRAWRQSIIRPLSKAAGRDQGGSNPS